MPSHYIFDANFFINVHQVYPRPIVNAIASSLKDNSAAPHVTELILGEIKNLRYSSREHLVEDVREVFDVQSISDTEIEELETKVGRERSPQHPDLSLMVLANKLGRTEPTVLVSDDFKIHTTQVKHHLPFEVKSPSAFLLELSNMVRDNTLRKTFRRLYRQVRRKEMEYMLSRRDTYNVEPKLSWLVDNLLGSGSGTTRRQPRIVPVSDTLEVDMDPIYRYIEGEKVRSSKLAPFKNILPHLDFLKESIGVTEEIRLHVEHGEFKSGIQIVRTASSRLRRKLQESSLNVNVNDGIKLRQVFAHYLGHYNFILAFLSLSDGEILLAEEWLDDAGFCALITKDNNDILKFSYIKSLIYFSMEDHVEAFEQFRSTETIAKTFGMDDTEFKAAFGKSITAFLSGDRSAAEKAMDKVHHLVEELGMEATHELMELADHLYHIGRVEVAMSVYNEALESALEWGQKDMVHGITNAMKQCDATLANAGVALDSDLSHLIDKAFDMAESCQEAYFKEVQEIVKHEAETLKPLPVLVSDWTFGKDLPKIYKRWMEVVKFIPMREPSDEVSMHHTLVLGYNPEVGTLGIYLKGTQVHSDVERYQVKFKEKGSFKILNAPDHYRRRYGMRGVVGVKDTRDIELKHLMSIPFMEEEAEDGP